MHSNRQRCTVALVLLLGLALLAPSASLALLSGLPDATAAKAADKCQKAIGKAGEKFVKNKQKKLDKCLGALSKCIQTKEAAKQADCIAKAKIKCDKDLAKIFTKDEIKLEQDIIKKCAVPGKLGVADLLAADGLGFSSMAPYCLSEFSLTLSDGVDKIAECIRRDKECTVERLFRVQYPRAKELLDDTPIAVGIRNNLTCLAGAAGTSAGFGATDPKGAGKAVDGCTKAAKKAGAKFVSTKLKSIEKCLAQVFKCVQTKPGDQSCIDKAAGKCAKEFGFSGKIAKAATKLASSVDKKCGPMKADFSDLASAMGMNLPDLTSVCMGVGVSLVDLDDYIQCLFRRSECLVDDMIALQYPRLEDLLIQVGFDGEVPASFCGPQPTPTTTTTPTPTATATPVPTVTSTPNNCGDGIVQGGEGELCDPNDPAMPQCPGAGNGLQNCTNVCTCECPGVVSFEVDPNDPASGLDSGWTGFAHGAKIIGQGVVTVALSGGDEGVPGLRDPTCGVMSISGPLQNLDAGAGQIDVRRCSVDYSILCDVDSDCPVTETCLTYFGSRLPLSAGGVAACITNRFTAPIVGTADIETGESATTVAISSEVVVGPAVDKPCDNCLGDVMVNDGSADGTCDTGSRAGLACDVNGISPIPAFNGVVGDPNATCTGGGAPLTCCTGTGTGTCASSNIFCTGAGTPRACCSGVGTGSCVNGTSLDCPNSPLGSNVGVLPINLSNSTSVRDLTVDATGPTCRAAGFGGSTCMCDTCDTLAGEPCNKDADCVPFGGSICGGLRCLGGGSAGTACTTPGISDPACGGAPCGSIGEATKPNPCTSTTCTTGACATGPFNGFCGPTETFRACLVTSDCPFAGDTCGFLPQPCFDDNGVVGGMITATGVPDVPVNDTSSPTLAAVFCIQPTGAAAINAASGLPGPGRVTLAGDAAGFPAP